VDGFNRNRKNDSASSNVNALEEELRELKNIKFELAIEKTAIEHGCSIY
jgi:hypothetical protein